MYIWWIWRNLKLSIEHEFWLDKKNGEIRKISSSIGCTGIFGRAGWLHRPTLPYTVFIAKTRIDQQYKMN